MKKNGLSPKTMVFFGYIKIISISYLGPTPIHQLGLPGLPVDFTAGLVANLLPGSTFAYGDHLLGNIIEFHLLMEDSNDSGFAGHEN